jgi:hypothetical protein
MEENDDHDGFYFLPGEDEGDLLLKYFKVTGEFESGNSVGSSELGDTYHIAFFKCGDDGVPIFDEHFEAIFSDPFIYMSGLAGSGLFGCVMKKTDTSAKWWEFYLTKTIESCKIVENQVANAV